MGRYKCKICGIIVNCPFDTSGDYEYFVCCKCTPSYVKKIKALPKKYRDEIIQKRKEFLKKYPDKILERDLPDDINILKII